MIKKPNSLSHLKMNQLGQDSEPSPCGCAHKRTLKHYLIYHQQCECYHQPEMEEENINYIQEG